MMREKIPGLQSWEVTMSTMAVGVDTGGTFTDVVLFKNGRWHVHKLLSTQDDPARAVLEGLGHIGGSRSSQIVHGSTVATNAMLERKGARTAIICNHGFEDLIEIGRQNRAQLYNLYYSKPESLVPRELRFGVPGRMDAQGVQIEPLDAEALTAIKQAVKSEDVQSIAVCLLFSYLNPDHEQMIFKELADLKVPVSLSHEILPEFREFERLSTTVVNAYVAPKMSGYLQRIKDSLHPSQLRIMQSNGGSISVEQAMREPVRTILSGPAGGVVGAVSTARAAGFERLITLDMGGTSTDVCLIQEDLPLSTEAFLSGLPLKVPMLDIHTVGAGGGSIARLDPGGALRVGPESAGSDPGPVCYGRGKEITVTDAHLYLGRIRPESFLGGNMILDSKRLERIFAQMSRHCGLDSVQLAEGVLAVADTNMERAIRVISVERGYDPRDFTLVSFGGAGGLHCAGLARALSIPRVLAPGNPGVLSALGMILADVVKDYSLTVMLPRQDTTPDALDKLFQDMEGQASREMVREGFKRSEVVISRFLDMRYQGQSFEIMVPWNPVEISRGFEELHLQKYGHKHSGRQTEIVNLRIRAIGSPHKPGLQTQAQAGTNAPQEAVAGRAKVVFGGREYFARILNRKLLQPGDEFRGPAVITEYTSTIAVPPFAAGRTDELGNIILEIDQE